MSKKIIINGDVTEEEKAKLIETFKCFEGGFDNFELSFKNNKYNLTIKSDERQIIATVTKI